MKRLQKRWIITGVLGLAACLSAGIEPVAAESAAHAVRSVKTAPDVPRVIALGKRESASPSETGSVIPAAKEIRNVRLEWPERPGAVQYQVVLLRSENDEAANIVLTRDAVFTNGVDINLSRFGKAAGGFYWKVCAQDYEGWPIGHFSKPKPITEGSTLNPDAPKPTTQFERMDYVPVYPVFSWIPVDGAKHHEVEVYRENDWGDSLVRRLSAEEYDVYEMGGYTTPGRYFWRVRSLDETGNPISGWSEKSRFTVTSPVPVAALGDSITHGGGAMSVPPGYLLYDWETYSPVPVKNIGFSGNTTEDMIERFERDVLPFSPRILVIMGGVNDYRGTVNGWTTVQHLKTLRDKCDAYGIIPVFATVTPINPDLMARRAHIEAPPLDWQVHQQYINDWIMRQTYCVDVSTMLADGTGCLRSNYTTDGLHPDYFGKKYIGERIGQYLLRTFPWITAGLVKKPVPVFGQ